MSNVAASLGSGDDHDHDMDDMDFLGLDFDEAALSLQGGVPHPLVAHQQPLGAGAHHHHSGPYDYGGGLGGGGEYTTNGGYAAGGYAAGGYAAGGYAAGGYAGGGVGDAPWSYEQVVRKYKSRKGGSTGRPDERRTFASSSKTERAASTIQKVVRVRKEKVASAASAIQKVVRKYKSRGGSKASLLHPTPSSSSLMPSSSSFSYSFTSILPTPLHPATHYFDFGPRKSAAAGLIHIQHAVRKRKRQASSGSSNIVVSSLSSPAGGADVDKGGADHRPGEEGGTYEGEGH